MKFSVTNIEGSDFVKENNAKNEEMIEQFRVKVLKEVLSELDDEQKRMFAEITSKICAKMLNEYLKERVRRGNAF